MGFLLRIRMGLNGNYMILKRNLKSLHIWHGSNKKYTKRKSFLFDILFCLSSCFFKLLEITLSVNIILLTVMFVSCQAIIVKYYLPVICTPFGYFMWFDYPFGSVVREPESWAKSSGRYRSSSLFLRTFKVLNGF